MSTPYSRLAHTHFVISPYTITDGTTTHFDISRDGQTASYSTDGVIWHTIEYQQWPFLISKLISMIRSAVASQMPSGVTVSDLADRPFSDDFSKVAPHRQANNEAQVKVFTKMFQDKMMSPTEGRHFLIQADGTLDHAMWRKYIKQDQEIKGLLSALFTSSSSVTLRAFQFGSIVFDSCVGCDRNVWLVDRRFVTGKPKAKQHNLVFADTIFWFPRAITSELIALLYYQVPFICSMLEQQNQHGHLYASHVWALPAKASRKIQPMVWNGREINSEVRKLTQNLIGTPIDPALMRQSSEGLLRDKIPALFQIFRSRENKNLEKGTYRHQSALELYAIRHGLHALAHAADIPIDRTSACLIIVDIWQSMHRIEDADPIWKPMVIDSHIFPTVAHDSLAYLGAQNHKMTANISSQLVFDQDSLTRGVKLLKDISLLNLQASATTTQARTSPHCIKKAVDISGAAAGHCFLKTIRTILFGAGRPRYGQTPPIGGIVFDDLVKAGAMVSYIQWHKYRTYILRHRFYITPMARASYQCLRKPRKIRTTPIFTMHFTTDGQWRRLAGLPSLPIFLMFGRQSMQRQQWLLRRYLTWRFNQGIYY